MFVILIKNTHDMSTKAQITQKTNFDSMWIKVKLASGANFRYGVTRRGESLSAGLSNDSKEAKKQMQTLFAWLKNREGENYEQAFKRIASTIEETNPQNAAQLISMTQTVVKAKKVVAPKKASTRTGVTPESELKRITELNSKLSDADKVKMNKVRSIASAIKANGVPFEDALKMASEVNRLWKLSN